MTVTSAKTSVLPFRGHDDNILCLTIRTSDQSRAQQPCLWTLHGSGGVSSNDVIWHDVALDKGYCIIWVDHYSPRDIFKVYHNSTSPMRLWSIDMAQDIILAKTMLDSNRHLVPFANLDDIKLIGFSSGATAAMYATRHPHTNWIRSVAALYPGIWPITKEILQADGHKIGIYVGELDDWTPAARCLQLAEMISGLRVTVLPDTHHSFSKPGAGGYYDDIVMTADIPYPVGIPMQDIKTFDGIYAILHAEHHGKIRGVHAEYNEASTMRVMDEFL